MIGEKNGGVDFLKGGRGLLFRKKEEMTGQEEEGHACPP